jgi:4-amino-4-deoxy-L-arabinose transferase-like glycosyltransferase
VRRALLLILLCIPTFFVFLGSAAITDSDEAYYAEASREMIESGDWITPRFNYELRFEKPILFYWMIAATYAVAGVSEGAARFWAAISGVGLVMVAYACGRRWIDEDAGFLGGAITATSFAAASMARQSLPDLPLAFFITLAVWAAFEAFARAERRPEGWNARRWLLLSSAACALAVLTKGPVGVVLPVLVVVPAVILEHFLRADPRPALRIRAIDLALAAAVFVLIAVPWYAAVTWVHGAGYLHRFFVAENLDRFATARYNDPRPIWFYIPILIGGLLPWSLFSVLWLRRPPVGFPETVRNSPELIRLIIWAAVPLAIFSVSVGKQPRYILPCLVPLALLLGSAISSRVRATSTGARDVLLTATGVLAGTVLLVVGVLLYRAAPLLVAAGGGHTTPWSALVVASAVAVMLVAAQRSARFLPATIAVASALTLLSLHGAILARPGPDPVVAAAQTVIREGASDLRVCACGAFLRNLPFYVRSPTVPAGTQAEVNAVLSSDAPTIAAIDARKLSEAETALNRRFERLTEIQYLNTALLRVDDFLRPDAERALQRVVIITTR